MAEVLVLGQIIGSHPILMAICYVVAFVQEPSVHHALTLHFDDTAVF